MDNLLAVICDLHELARTTTDEKTRTKLLNLWVNLGRIKRANEALRVGSLHSEETLRISEDELNRLLSAESLCEKLID
tara:strand:- start:2827 stop:3060 length:234 start_codon:yes stop_codon:yes gene_type:complete